MKNILLKGILGAFIIMIISCTDPCKDVDCHNGTCDEGSCICDDGYEGTHCDTRSSLKFTGRWEGTFDCGTASDDAVVDIVDEVEDLRKIQLITEGVGLTFDGLSFTLDNTVLNGRINQSFQGFVIDTQKMTIEIPNNPGISADVFGSGNLINDNQLDIVIKVKNDDFGASFSCNGTVNK